MLANIEFFIFLLIAGGSALFNWLQKRKQAEEEWHELPPPSKPPTRTQNRNVPPPVSQPKQTSNWEEELRRMLEGTVPTTRTPPPPPPIIAQERRPTPPPVTRQPEFTRTVPPPTPPKTFSEKYYKAHCNHCGEHIEFPASATDEMISCPHCHRATVLRPFQDTRVEALSHQKDLSSFDFGKKYEAASQMSERVAAHMHGAGHKPVGTTSIETRKQIWPEVAETKALFKNARTVRQAMIASLILGPPKALENSAAQL